MSKFIDRLTKLSTGERQSMGFTNRQTASPKTKMQVIAALEAENAASLTGHVAGADVVLLKMSDVAKGAGIMQKLSSDTVKGAWLQGGSGKEDVKALTEAGCDFIVFSADAPVTIIKKLKDTGKVFQIEDSISDGLLRTLNGMTVDAVLLTGERRTQPLTVQQLLVFRRFADFLNKPLLVSAPAEITIDELETLWESGINGVVVEINAMQPEDGLTRLRKEIDKFEFPSRKSSRGGSAMLPRASQQAPAAHHDDDDDEDE